MELDQYIALICIIAGYFALLVCAANPSKRDERDADIMENGLSKYFVEVQRKNDDLIDL